MKELLDPALVERVLLLTGVLGPVAGAAVGAAAGFRARRPAAGTIAGALVGGVGTLVYAMWRVYGAITGALGLDSLANLALQLLLFAALGAGIGALIVRISRILDRLGAENRP